MDEFVVEVDGVVRFVGAFDEALAQARAMRDSGERPVVRRARPDEHATGDDEWEDDDDVIPF